MADLHTQVKDAVHTTASEKSIFTEIEKQRVLRKIRSGDTQSSQKSKQFVPKMVTSIAVAGFLLFIGGIIGTNMENNNKATQSNNVADEEKFYPNLQDGEMFNGWSLLNKGPSEGTKREQSGLLHAVFQGEAQITGTLKYYDIDDSERPDQILFTPDKLSIQSLPVEEGRHPDLTFASNEQRKLKAVFGLGTNRIDIGEVTLVVDNYTARYLKGKTLPDTVGLKEIVLPVEPEVQSTPFHIQVNQGQKLELSAVLLDRYEQFKVTKEKQALSGLSPSEVFQLYFYAEELQDYETQYSLFIDDEEYLRVFATYEDYLTAKQQNPSTGLLEQVKVGTLFEHIIDETSASVSIEAETKGLSFGLSKNKLGIWCVNWLPIQ
ncbi:hypothetical protein ACVBAX_09875 [Robertmurraya sp. GLU-23]